MAHKWISKKYLSGDGNFLQAQIWSQVVGDARRNNPWKVPTAKPPDEVGAEDDNRCGLGELSAALRLLDCVDPEPGLQALLLLLESADDQPSRAGSMVQTFLQETDGMNSVMTLLLAGTGNVRWKPRRPSLVRPSTRLLSLHVLNWLCDVERDVSSLFLCKSDEVIIVCLHALADPDLHDEASSLLRNILIERKEALNLCAIPDLKPALGQLDGPRLLSFCKTLAVILCEHEHEHRSLLKTSQNPSRKEYLPVRDVNQMLVLSIPGFLEKVVALACRSPYLSLFARHDREINQRISLTVDSISQEIALETSEHPLEVVGFAHSRVVSKDLTSRTQALNVISLLLEGKHRKQVQDELAQLHISQRLSELFDKFCWKRRGASTYSDQEDAEGLECSLEMALKIQFLRFVHSFCDYNDSKHVLLSALEWNELFGICQDAALPFNADIDARLMCLGTTGLLSKMVAALKSEPTTSIFQFWLCRALESYLRGPSSYADQVFLLRRGLLQHLITLLTGNSMPRKEIVQSSFDLLGEIVKFNIEACQQIASMFNTESKLERFIKLIDDNLVDSNMLIRAISLAADHFILEKEPEANGFPSRSTLLGFFSNFNQHVHYIVKLIELINVDNLTQENISCLNTSLVLMMMANRNGMLPKCLSAIAKARGGLGILRNLRSLLIFWKDHYTNKDGDCNQLEKSSRIPFDYWMSTVNILVSTDFTVN